jgi:hypothetical protein
MEIRQITDNLTGRVDSVTFISKHFMDQKILKNLTRVFVGGGTITIDADDGYQGTTHYPGPAEEQDP